MRAFVLVLILVTATQGQALCQAQSQEIADKPGAAAAEMHGPRLALSSGASAMVLTDDAREVADKLDLPALLANLDRAKARAQNLGDSSAVTLDTFAARQELLEARQEYAKRVLKASLEVDYVISAIDGEQHRFEIMRADLESNRDSAVLLTNIAAQISNGVLWILSCSYTVASRTQSGYDTNDGINGILAGAIPTVLSLYAFYQLKGKACDLTANPNMLAPLLGTGNDARHYYPKSVLDFLNSTPRGETQTRRETLISYWTKNKFLEKPNSKTYQHSTQIMSGTLSQKRALTIALINKQQTMLADLRTQVCTMKRGLLELIPALD
jgi:hypothetical protein